MLLSVMTSNSVESPSITKLLLFLFLFPFIIGSIYCFPNLYCCNMFYYSNLDAAGIIFRLLLLTWMLWFIMFMFMLF